MIPHNASEVKHKKRGRAIHVERRAIAQHYASTPHAHHEAGERPGRCREAAGKRPSRCRVASESLSSRCRVAVESVPSRCRVAVESVPSRCRVAAESLPSRRRKAAASCMYAVRDRLLLTLLAVAVVAVRRQRARLPRMGVCVHKHLPRCVCTPYGCVCTPDVCVRCMGVCVRPMCVYAVWVCVHTH
jgi:hypothetical protein